MVAEHAAKKEKAAFALFWTPHNTTPHNPTYMPTRRRGLTQQTMSVVAVRSIEGKDKDADSRQW